MDQNSWNILQNICLCVSQKKSSICSLEGYGKYDVKTDLESVLVRKQII